MGAQRQPSAQPADGKTHPAQCHRRGGAGHRRVQRAALRRLRTRPSPGFHPVLDNASWHKARRLHWHHFTPVYLPPYSPDYNAIERLWLHLKSKWFAGFTARTEDALMSRLLEAFASLFASPALITSQCRVSGDDF